jgi:hypothetical protein
MIRASARSAAVCSALPRRRPPATTDTAPADPVTTVAPITDLATMDLATMDLATMDLAIMDLAIMDLAIMDLAIMDLAIMDLAIMDLATMDPATTDLATTDTVTSGWKQADGSHNLSSSPPPRNLIVAEGRCADASPGGDFAILASRSSRIVC